jgi:predicted RNA-binding protein with PUA-like domain
MAKGDLLLFYHSNEGKDVVGIAKVARTAYPDPTADPDDDDWSVVDVAPVKRMKAPVPLTTIRDDPTLAEMQLLRRSRLSVVPVTPEEFARVLELGKTKL